MFYACISSLQQQQGYIIIIIIIILIATHGHHRCKSRRLAVRFLSPASFRSSHRCIGIFVVVASINDFPSRVIAVSGRPPAFPIPIEAPHRRVSVVVSLSLSLSSQLHCAPIAGRDDKTMLLLEQPTGDGVAQVCSGWKPQEVGQEWA